MWTVDYNNSEEFEAAIKTIMSTQVWLGGGGRVMSPLLGLQGQISAVFLVPGSPFRVLIAFPSSLPLGNYLNAQSRNPPVLQLQGTRALTLLWYRASCLPRAALCL